jgi:hypothetical protein
MSEDSTVHSCNSEFCPFEALRVIPSDVEGCVLNDVMNAELKV